MATIALEGMRFFSKIGFYEEERIIGNQFVVDVYIEANTKMAAPDKPSFIRTPKTEILNSIR